MNKMIGLSLLITGLLIGPAYYAYQLYFSGKVITQSTVYSSGQWQSPMTVSLTPAMNTVSIQAKAWFKPKIGKQHQNHYLAQCINADGQILWQERFQLSGLPKQDQMVKNNVPPAQTSATVLIHQFQAPTSGDYQLIISATEQADMPLQNLDIVVREQAQQPSKNTLIGGALAALVGLVLLVL
ncbi:MAG: hypothetical protein SVC26_02410 [Pseudomonadota bacterium]|nr:hypothetical protein [Pseudomonadota bacterium]